MDGLNELTGSSTPSGACIKLMAKEDEYRPGVLGTVIGVSVALVALLGVAGAAYADLIPGVDSVCGACDAEQSYERN